MFLACSSIHGQSIHTEIEETSTVIAKAITAKGYQSVKVQIAESKVTIFYENRVQRFEPRAIIEIIRTIGANELPKNIDTIHLVTQKLQIPVLTTIFTVSAFQNWAAGKITLTEFISGVRVVQGGPTLTNNKNKTFLNSGNYRVEIEIKPEIGLGLGGFPDPVIHRFLLIPTANIYLWKGAKIQLETILPISSEFQLPEEHFIRPGILALNQTLRLPSQIWLQGSIGYFSKNRYGGRLSAGKFFWNGAMALTGHIGYTGYAAYPIKFGLEKAVKGWEYADIDYLDYNVGINYWFKQWNTQLRLEYGRELLGKNQLKFTCLQRFNEVDIGFFALKTQRGNNYGMQLSLPIFPKKYWKPKRVSIRPANRLNYTYQATQATVESYNTGSDILSIHRQLNPAFIKDQLTISKRWLSN